MATEASCIAKEQLVDVLKNAGDEEKIISAALQACLKVVKGKILKAAAVRWFDQQAGVESLEESDPKFGDGIDKAQGANKPSEIIKLDYYPKDYKPFEGHLDNEKNQNDLLHSIATWAYPTGALWDAKTMEDLKLNTNVVAEHHSDGLSPGIVLPLYLYSASQKSRPFTWAVWNADANPPTWTRVAQQQPLEDAYQKDPSKFALNSNWFKAKGLECGTCTMEGLPVPADSEHVLGFFDKNIKLIRFETPQDLKGRPMRAPLHDTVAWLPPPSQEDFNFDPPLADLPPSGVIEYIYSRNADESITWAGWDLGFALGTVTKIFIEKLFAEPNQQEYIPERHKEFKSFLKFISTKQADDVFISWIASAADIKDPFFEAIEMFTDAKTYLGDLDTVGITGPLLRDLIQHKVGTNAEPPPGILAHALELQHLVWNGQHFILALSGSKPSVLVNGKVVTLARCNNTFDDQIFWQLNYTMRMKQWKATPKFHINEKGPAQGVYPYQPATSTFADLARPDYTIEADSSGWHITSPDSGKTQITDYWFEAATWLLEAVSPLMYFIDRAIEKAKTDVGPGGLKTYRGLRNVSLPRSLYGDDKVVLWGAYSSTSGDRGVATSFAGDDTKVAVFSLTGTTPVCIARWSRFGREREWLYPANTQFQVTSALSEEQQELLGKKNLQIFSMTEVDENQSVLAYLRSLVNAVIQSEKAARMPRHVSQIFRIMQAVEESEYRTALQECCDPKGLVVTTEAGVDIAHLLQKLSEKTTSGVLEYIARYQSDSDPAALIDLVKCGSMIGLEVSDAFRWVQFFEENDRKLLSKQAALIAQEMSWRKDITLEQFKEHAPFLESLQVYQLSNLAAVEVTGLRSTTAHMNGVYKREGNEMKFLQVSPVRVNSFPVIAWDEATKLWRLTDTAMRGIDRDPMWDRWEPVNRTILTWGGLQWMQDPCRDNVMARQDWGWPKIEKHIVANVPRNELPFPKPVYEYMEEYHAALCEEDPDYRRELFEAKGYLDGEEEGQARDPDLDTFTKIMRRMKNKRVPEVVTNETPFVIPVELGTVLRTGPSPNLDDSCVLSYDVNHYEEVLPDIPTEEEEEEDTELAQEAEERESPQAEAETALEAAPERKNNKKVTLRETFRSRMHEDIGNRRFYTRTTVSDNFTEAEYNTEFRSYLYMGPHEEFYQRWCRVQEQDQQIANLQYDVKKFETGLQASEARVKHYERYMADEKNTARKKYQRDTTFLEPYQDTDWWGASASPQGNESGLITIGVGQAGCQVCEELWRLYYAEHEMDKAEGVGGWDVLFSDKASGERVPRGLFIDTDPTPPETIKASLNGYGFQDRSFLAGKGSCATFSRAESIYTDYLVTGAAEEMRRQAEELDVILGFQMHHAIGGGVGSGVACKLLKKMASHYPKARVQNYCIFPSPEVSTSVVEPYNAMLAAGMMLRDTTFTVVFDNQAIYRLLAAPTMKVPDISYVDLNRLIAQVNAAVTCSFRFPAVSNRIDLATLETNLVPYPMLHQIVPSYAPLLSKYYEFSGDPTVASLTKAVSHTALVSTKGRGKLLGGHLQYRGNISEGVANKSCERLKAAGLESSWQSCLKMAVSKQAPGNLPAGYLQKFDKSLTMLSNTSAVTSTLSTIHKKWKTLYAKRAFVHYYQESGSEEQQFLEAAEDIMTVEEYYKEATTELEEDDDDYY